MPLNKETKPNTGCSLEDLLGTMKDREGWRERVRDICAGSTS